MRLLRVLFATFSSISADLKMTKYRSSKEFIAKYFTKNSLKTLFDALSAQTIGSENSAEFAALYLKMLSMVSNILEDLSIESIVNADILSCVSLDNNQSSSQVVEAVKRFEIICRLELLIKNGQCEVTKILF